MMKYTSFQQQKSVTELMKTDLMQNKTINK